MRRLGGGGLFSATTALSLESTRHDRTAVADLHPFARRPHDGQRAVDRHDVAGLARPRRSAFGYAGPDPAHAKSLPRRLCRGADRYWPFVRSIWAAPRACWWPCCLFTGNACLRRKSQHQYPYRRTCLSGCLRQWWTGHGASDRARPFRGGSCGAHDVVAHDRVRCRAIARTDNRRRVACALWLAFDLPVHRLLVIRAAHRRLDVPWRIVARARPAGSSARAHPCQLPHVLHNSSSQSDMRG